MAKTKVQISCAVTVQLICVFVFAYAKSRFSHNEAQSKDNVCQISIKNKSGHGSLVGSVSASSASGPEIDPHIWHILSWKIYFLLLIQEELVVSFWPKNGH